MTKKRDDSKLKMCLECGAVREDISPDSDVCTECKSGPTSTHPNATKELIEFVEYMGFERPVILAAIMKLQLDNQSIINTETVVGAIGELLAPIEDDNTGAHQSTTSPPSTVPHLPMHNPPPPKLATPSAPPLHTQDSPASDSDRTKCKVNCFYSAPLFLFFPPFLFVIFLC